MTKSAEQQCALVLMCKRPTADTSKQRVARTAGSDAARALAIRLLDCAMADLAEWQGPQVIAIANADDVGWARTQTTSATVVAQTSGNLGDRIEQVTAQALDLAPNVLLIGMDAPTLTHRYLVTVADALNDNDLALGGAVDGGVVAMACRGAWPPLSALPWSTPQLGRALAAAANQQEKTVAWLDAHTDIDHEDQFQSMIDMLATDLRPTRQRLRQWLSQHVKHNVIGHTQPV